MWGPLWKNKTINLTIIFNPYYYRKKSRIIIIIIINIIAFVCITEYQNKVFNMTIVTLEGFAGKICSTAGPLFEELEGKN